MRTLRHAIIRDRSGIGAVEFALIAPVLIVVFMGAIELPRAYVTARKLDRAARTMSDLVSRTSLASLDDVYAAGAAVVDPLDATMVGMRLSAVGVYTGGAARICSVGAKNVAAEAVNAALGVAPPIFATPGSRYVKAEVRYTYVPVFNLFTLLKGMTFVRTATWPVRRGTTYYGDPEVLMPGGAKCPAS
jgi:Flp pilus assembly protein TadG